jgi:hypothetical protein
MSQLSYSTNRSLIERALNYLRAPSEKISTIMNKYPATQYTADNFIDAARERASLTGCDRKSSDPQYNYEREYIDEANLKCTTDAALKYETLIQKLKNEYNVSQTEIDKLIAYHDLSTIPNQTQKIIQEIEFLEQKKKQANEQQAKKQQVMIGVGVLFIFVALGLGIFFLYRRNKQQK